MTRLACNCGKPAHGSPADLDFDVHVVVAQEARKRSHEVGAGTVGAHHAPRRLRLVDLDQDALPLAPDRNGVPVHGQVEVGFDVQRAPH